MTNLSHNLENLLDSLRLGRIELGPDTLDLLFEAVALFNRIVGETAGGSGDSTGLVGDFIERLDRVTLKRVETKEELPWGGFDLDPNMLSVLTEYEEHRLRENIKAGRALYRIHAAFELLTIDKGLDQLKSRLKPVGEVITYLPSAESANEQQIELDIVLGAPKSIAEVMQAVEGSGARVFELPKKASAPAAPAPVAPALKTAPRDDEGEL